MQVYGAPTTQNNKDITSKSFPVTLPKMMVLPPHPNLGILKISSSPGYDSPTAASSATLPSLQQSGSKSQLNMYQA